MTMDLYEELRGLIDALDESGLEYALCGGVALAFHGHPRFTKDIDLLIRAEDLQKAREAVARRGFAIEGGSIPLHVGRTDEGVLHRVSKVAGSEVLTLDLLIVGPALEPIWKTRGVFAWKGRKVKVLSREGLAEMKRRAGRAQDIADVEKLEGRE
jgi:hypothetical protein